jgi:hypothetical protein
VEAYQVDPSNSHNSSNLVEGHSSQGKVGHSSSRLLMASHMATKQQLLQATMEVPQVAHNPHSSQGNNNLIITQLMVDMVGSLVDQTINECRLC